MFFVEKGRFIYFDIRVKFKESYKLYKFDKG